MWVLQNRLRCRMDSDVQDVQGRTRIPVEKCNFTWSIENFSFYYCVNGEILTSPCFTTGSSFSTTWYLTMYPNGRNKDESEGKIGIYLTRKSNDSRGHFAVFKISFLGRNREKTHSIEFEHLYDKPKTGFGAFDFINRKTLLGKEKHSLLPNDTLTVFCELKVSQLGSDTVSESEVACLNVPSSANVSALDLLSRHLQELYLSQKYSDFTLKIEKEELPVHKNILCARSPVFATMLHHDMKEKLNNCVEIRDMDPSVVKKMIDFIYCGQLSNLTSDVAVQLYHAGEKYALRDMKRVCAEFLLSHLSLENACDVLLLGDLYEELELIEAAKNFIHINAARVQETEAWLTMSLKKPDLFFTLNREIISGRKMVKLHTEPINNT